MGLRSLILFFIGCTISSAQVNWMTMDEALAAQKSNPKKIIVDVYTSWCGPCKLLDKNTFGNAEISAFINQNYYPVKFNAEGKEEVNFNGNRFENPRYDPNRKGRNARHQFTAYLGITGYPTVAFFDENANYIAPIVGYHNVQQMEFYLKLFSSNDYKQLKSQEDFTITTRISLHNSKVENKTLPLLRYHKTVFHLTRRFFFPLINIIFDFHLRQLPLVAVAESNALDELWAVSNNNDAS